MIASSHWYNADGTACFEVPTASKTGVRNVTIKDARKLGLFPSVTTILNILSKPQLDRWKLEQVALACAKETWKGKAIDEYVNERIEAAFQQVTEAADLGTDIHKALELHFQGKPYDQNITVYVEAVQKWVTENKINFTAHELRLVNKRDGYAGTTDAAFTCTKGFGILDFKTRKTEAGKPVKAYDDQVVQISAYHVAHYRSYVDFSIPGASALGVNLFISTTEPGRVEAVWYSEEELVKAREAFMHTCELWRYLKGYDPRIGHDLVS